MLFQEKVGLGWLTSFVITSALTLALLPSPPQAPCNYTGHIQITQGDLPSQGPLLNHSCEVLFAT